MAVIASLNSGVDVAAEGRCSYTTAEVCHDCDRFMSKREPLDGHKLYGRVSGKPAKLKLGRVKNTIGDSSFWRKLGQIIAFLDPMIEALRELESDNCPTSRVYTRFHWLLNHPAYVSDDAPSELQAAIKKFIDARWSHEHTDATGLAFLLDPHTNLDYFVGSDETDTITQGCEIAERSGILHELGVTRAEFNSAIERAWSIMDFIHSKKRNRLTTDKVDMLANIYVDHQSVLKEDADWARLYSYPESCEALERDVTEQCELESYSAELRSEFLAATL
ncbi:unnamed protein product [Phytophthora fragariaefolia]|uniref:Unnamed protein product n=1 Tax=Phytophthora fragariaefolia TaxID=1490495 RepID=A0A9W7CM82_9STRA|nr:unnamed protein product [Phytophthora fragariaefolia]